jgi:hypothetical protein
MCLAPTCRFCVAQVSKPAVSPTSKSASDIAAGGFGNPRHSRLGSLRYPKQIAACAQSWMGGRLYLQIKTVRASPQIDSSLVFRQINRFKPHTKWFYASDPIYSFHAGIPMPPDLAVVMLKRLWSGEMTGAKIAAEMRDIQPGIVLLRNDSRAVPFHDLIRAQYQLVYEDREHLLYIHKSIARK